MRHGSIHTLATYMVAALVLASSVAAAQSSKGTATVLDRTSASIGTVFGDAESPAADRRLHGVAAGDGWRAPL